MVISTNSSGAVEECNCNCRSTSALLHVQFDRQAMSSSTAVDVNDLSTLRYAQEAACLLQPISQKPELARVQTLRAHELEERLGQNKKSLRNSIDACSFCGALIVPGWTGCIRIDTVRPGRRTRKRERDAGGIRNQVVWTCKACGCSATQSGSDPNTKSKFRPGKKHKPLATLLTQTAASSPGLPKQQNAPTSTPALQAASLTRRPISPTTALSKPTPPPAKTLRVEPSSSSTAPSQKKKRSKREGLQAMLQAKKEQDEKAKQAAVSLGLSSFLKGLQ